jgi:hypothetical protein
VSVVVAGLTLAFGGCSTTPEPVAAKPVAAKPAPVKVVKKHIPKPTRPPARPAEPAHEEAPAEAPPPVAAAAPTPATVAALPAPQLPVVQEPAPAVAVAPPPIAPVPPAPVPPAPVDVVGKSETDLIALLGRPRHEQVASAAKVMRFAAEGCEVEVHLFPDVKQGGYRVLETSGGGMAPSQCLGKVRAARG